MKFYGYTFSIKIESKKIVLEIWVQLNVDRISLLETTNETPIQTDNKGPGSKKYFNSFQLVSW